MKVNKIILRMSVSLIVQFWIWDYIDFDLFLLTKPSQLWSAKLASPSWRGLVSNVFLRMRFSSNQSECVYDSAYCIKTNSLHKLTCKERNSICPRRIFAGRSLYRRLLQWRKSWNKAMMTLTRAVSERGLQNILCCQNSSVQFFW